MMRILLLTVLAAGCAASSSQLESESRRHLQQAQASAGINDYERAARERERADELHADAVKRALKEGRAGDLAFVSP